MNLPKVFSEIEFSKSEQERKHLSLPIMTDPRQGSAKPGGGAAFPMRQADSSFLERLKDGAVMGNTRASLTTEI